MYEEFTTLRDEHERKKEKYHGTCLSQGM